MADPGVKEVVSQIAESARGPVTEALTLPPAAYRSSELYELEQEYVIRPHWTGVCREAELPDAGDYLTLEIAGEPIIVLRQRGGTLQAFPNVCLHRMSHLLMGCGNVSRIECPYHGWTYGTDGSLLAAPYMNGFDITGRGLHALRTETMHGLVFVSLNDSAEPLERYAAGLPSVLEGFGLTDHIILNSGERTFSTNWKAFVENFIESLHTFMVHPETFLPYVGPLQAMKFGEQTSANFTFHDLKATPESGMQALGDMPVPEDKRDAFFQIGIFPNSFLAVSPTQSSFLTFQPDTIDRTTVRYSVAVHPDFLGDADPAAFWAENMAEQMEGTLDEDETIVNLMRIRSSFGARSPISPLERPLWEFQRFLTRQLEAVPGLLD